MCSPIVSLLLSNITDFTYTNHEYHVIDLYSYGCVDFHRQLNKSIVADVGLRNSVIWNLLLSGAPERVMALLVLMAGDIKSDRTEDQTEFWRYVFECRSRVFPKAHPHQIAHTLELAY